MMLLTDEITKWIPPIKGGPQSHDAHHPSTLPSLRKWYGRLRLRNTTTLHAMYTEPRLFCVACVPTRRFPVRARG